MRTDLFKEFSSNVNNGKLHLFSIYTDFGAYRHIKCTVGAIAKLAGQRRQCSSETWKLDSLTVSEPMGKMLANDAANVDALIVVVNPQERCKPELIQWLDSLEPLNPHRPGLLIGLLGDEEDKSEELDWTARELIRCAQKTNRKFIWHWMEHHSVDSAGWLAEGVEMLLTQKRAAYNGLNGIAAQEAVLAFR